MFETFETLSNPPLYQKGVNSISYLLNKAFQKPEIFIKHIQHGLGTVINKKCYRNIKLCSRETLGWKGG